MRERYLRDKRNKKPRSGDPPNRTDERREMKSISE
jgi:hypothetical protein